MHPTRATLTVVFFTALVVFVSALADNSGGYGLHGLANKVLRPS